MYKKLNITENHLKILSLFTRGFDKEYYIREVQRLLRVSPRTAQLILDDLENKAVLESETKGKIKLYRVKESDIAREYLIFSEVYKRISFFEANDLIREVLIKVIPNIKGVCVVFGSYAKGIQKKGSDLDVFVVGSYRKKEIDKMARMYGVDINIKSYPLRVFKKELRKDILLREILDDHVIVYGVEDFVDLVMKSG